MNWGRIATVLGVVVVVLFVVQRVISPGDEYDIENSIEEVATSSDPSFCTELVTPAYLAQVYDLPADAAVDSCAEYAGEEVLQADSVDVDEIEVNGDRATAEATYSGTTLDGSTILFELIRQGGEWKLDKLIEVVRLDRSGFLAAYRDQLVDPLYGFPPSSADCVEATLSRWSDPALEELLGDPDAVRVGRLLIGCDRSAMEELVLAPIRRSPAYPASLIDCVAAATRAASDARLLQLYDDVLAYAELAVGCDRKAYLDRFRAELVGDPYEYPDEFADCVIARLDRLPGKELVAATYDRSDVESLIEACEE